MDPIVHTPPPAQPYQPAPVSPPVVPASTPPHNRPLIVAAIVGAVVLLLAVAAYATGIWPFSKSETAMVSPSPSASASPMGTANPTAGWKTYREGNFEIKYPENFNVSFGGMDFLSGEIKDFEWNQDGYSYPYIKYPQETRFYMQVQAITTDGSPIQEWLGKNTEKVQIINEYKPLEGVLISEKSITISGLSGIQRIMRYQGNSGTIDIILSYVSQGNEAYRIVGHSVTPNNLSLYKQILSTFKFTDTTAGWKTYTNAQYGFEFKYPDNTTIRIDSSIKSFNFCIPSSAQASGYYCQMGIMIYTKAEYQKVEDDVAAGKIPPPGVMLGQNSTYVAVGRQSYSCDDTVAMCNAFPRFDQTSFRFMK